jgi:hypothetical protein
LFSFLLERLGLIWLLSFALLRDTELGDEGEGLGVDAGDVAVGEADWLVGRDLG